MSEHAQTVARTMEVGGSTIAVTPWLASVLGFLDQHSQAGMLLCAMVGAFITIAGFALNWYFKVREDRRRQAESNALFIHLRTPPRDEL